MHLKISLTFSYTFILLILNLFHSKFSGRKNPGEPSRYGDQVTGCMMKELLFDCCEGTKFIFNPQVACRLCGRPNLLHNGYPLSPGVNLPGLETDISQHLVPGLIMLGAKPHLHMLLRVMVSN
jgi:hypothetical protein